MNQMDRRSFLRCAGQAALGLGVAAYAGEALAAPAADDGAVTKKSVKVPLGVRLQPSWLSWVSCVTGCLNALGVACDHIDVAGHSGYAFLTIIGENVDVSGPTSANFSLLASGLPPLGRSALLFTGGTCMKGKSDDARFAYDLVAREVAAGRPCVLWGAHLPEFGVAIGVEDGKYQVVSLTGNSDPIPFDKLSACTGVQVLTFPTAAGRMGVDPDAAALHRALTCLRYETGDPRYASGHAAYDRWIAAMEKGGLKPFDHSYNVQCWADAKRMAHAFVTRLAGRNHAVRTQLQQAAAAYAEVVTNMDGVAALFPFPDAEKRIDDLKVRVRAARYLYQAKTAEAKAATALTQAAAHWPKRDLTKETAMLAPCGIDCAQCDVLARGECAGCRGDRRHQWSDGCGLRTCCTDTKHLTLCSQCGEFPCQQFKEWAAAYPHHGAALERLKQMRQAEAAG